MSIKTFANSWPLFLSIAFLMLGNGLQGTLVSWRASYEGFPIIVTGIIMAGYFGGILLGTFFTNRLIELTGHVRVFAALSSLASVAILLQAVFISAPFWFFMRLATGFCFSGIYIIAESWLNEQSDNNTRGSTMAVYMFITFLAMGVGQWFMKADDPTDVNLFIIASVLLSIALVPVLLTKIQAPEISIQKIIKLKKLFSISPSGVISMLLVGLTHSSIFGLGSVYGNESGLDISQIALFMSLIIFAGAIGSWALGIASDLYDRRLFIALCSGVSAIMCGLMMILEAGSWSYFIAVTILGAFCLPMYSIAFTHINDRLEPKQMVAAAGTIILVFGIGSVIGPMLSGYFIKIFGAVGFLIYNTLLFVIIVVSSLISISRREAVPEQEQASYQATPVGPTIVSAETIAKDTIEELEEVKKENRTK